MRIRLAGSTGRSTRNALLWLGQAPGRAKGRVLTLGRAAGMRLSQTLGTARIRLVEATSSLAPRLDLRQTEVRAALIRLLQSIRSYLAARPLLLIMVLALAVRIYQLDLLGYNSDEAVYAGQAAAIANDPVLKQFFPIFRAHPLLFQFLLALVFRGGVEPVLGRMTAAAVGVLNVLLVYRLGKELYGRRAGLLAALILSLMPYLVVVNRQVLLDGPMTLCATLTLLLTARYASTHNPRWLYAAGAGMGLTFLAKEIGIVLLGAVYAFLALSPEIRVKLRQLAVSVLAMGMVIAPFPLSLALAGGASAGRNYLVWQLFRRPNHEWNFYPTTVPFAIGPAVILAALLGVWLLRHERSWKEKLLLVWIAVPIVFFQIWPVKGYQYLLPIAPPLALLAARSLARAFSIPDLKIPQNLRWPAVSLPIGRLATGIVAFSLLIPSLRAIYPSASDRLLAGSGGVPGGREAGEWVGENVPEGATLMTIGPSMANILQFYGHRQAYGLSVSPNPLHRNPSYEPIANPDFAIRTGAIQYLVWDAYSAGRSEFFSQKLLDYMHRYNGRVIHTESISVAGPDGNRIPKPVIVIYAVRP